MAARGAGAEPQTINLCATGLVARSCKVQSRRSCWCNRLDIPRRFQAGLSDGFRFGDQKVRTQMIMLIKTLAAVAAGPALPRTPSPTEPGASPYVAIENEPPPKLIVDPTPLAGGPAHCIVGLILCGERAYRTSVRGRRAQCIPTGRASAHTRRRPALGLGGSE